MQKKLPTKAYFLERVKGRYAVPAPFRSASSPLLRSSSIAAVCCSWPANEMQSKSGGKTYGCEAFVKELLVLPMIEGFVRGQIEHLLSG